MNNAVQSISVCFSKYATFKGTADRQEFWWFYLFSTFSCMLIDIWVSTQGLNHPDSKETYEAIGNIYILSLLLPSISVATRRLHDIGKSGWWQLLLITIIGIVPLIYWWASKGQNNENKYTIDTSD